MFYKERTVLCDIIKAMKFAHLADLHLGRKVHSYSMIENQRKVLEQVVEKVIKKEVDAVILAGDIYDSSVPEAEAMEVLNEFLTSLRAADIEVFMIAGTHDNGDLIDYGAGLLEAMDIHVCGRWNGAMECIDMLDRYGPLHVWCLPYITPAMINRYRKEEDAPVETFTDAMRYALSTAKLDLEERNILIAHQYFEGVTVIEGGPEDYLSLSKEAVDVSVIQGYDYVALGHIHTAQAVGSETIRYSGAPLNYSIAEIGMEKSFTLLTLEEKGTFRISTIALTPEKDMLQISGTFNDLISKEMCDQYRDSYVNIILEETDEIPDAIYALKEKYPYVMGVSYADGRVRLRGKTEIHVDLKDGMLTEVRTLNLKAPQALFQEFYEDRTGEKLSFVESQYMNELIAKAFGEEK